MNRTFLNQSLICPERYFHPPFAHVKQNISAMMQGAVIMGETSSCLSAPRTQSRARGCVLPGPLPRCHGERGEWNNNAHVTAAVRSFSSFRSKGLFGAARSAVGTNNGGRAERAARGQIQQAARMGPSGCSALPPACCVNFEMDAPTVARDARFSRLPTNKIRS